MARALAFGSLRSSCPSRTYNRESRGIESDSLLIGVCRLPLRPKYGDRQLPHLRGLDDAYRLGENAKAAFDLRSHASLDERVSCHETLCVTIATDWLVIMA